MDDDVADALIRESRHSGQSYRQVVNSAIRRGLGRQIVEEPFRVMASDLHRRPGVDIDDIEELLDVLDGQTRR